MSNSVDSRFFTIAAVGGVALYLYVKYSSKVDLVDAYKVTKVRGKDAASLYEDPNFPSSKIRFHFK